MTARRDGAPGRGVDVRVDARVARPRAAVAAFMFDPANDLAWTGGITSSRPTRPGPLETGATVDRTARFLGRTFDYRYVVVRHDPERMVEMTVDRPFPMRVRYELADDGARAATLVTIHASGTPGRFFGWARPLMSRQVRRSIAADLSRLRACLERPAPAGGAGH